MVIQRGEPPTPDSITTSHPPLRLQPGCQVSPELHKMETRRAAQLTVNTQPFFFQAGSWRSWNPVLTCLWAHDAPALLRPEHNLLKSTPSSQAPRPDLPRPLLRLRKHRPHCRLPRAGVRNTTTAQRNFLNVYYFPLKCPLCPRPSSFVMLLTPLLTIPSHLLLHWWIPFWIYALLIFLSTSP